MPEEKERGYIRGHFRKVGPHGQWEKNLAFILSMMESHWRDLERSKHHDIICVFKIQLHGA